MAKDDLDATGRHGDDRAAAGAGGSIVRCGDITEAFGLKFSFLKNERLRLSQVVSHHGITMIDAFHANDLMQGSNGARVSSQIAGSGGDGAGATPAARRRRETNGLKWRAVLAAAAAALLSATAAAQNPDLIDTTETFRQSEAVRRLYPDLPVPLDAPTLNAKSSGFTDHAGMMAFLRNVASRSGQMVVLSAGASQQGREIPLALFTAEGDRTLAAAAARADRPVVWLLGLQHGNEPAGGEAMLALAAELAGPQSRELLSKVTIVVAPRMNPDGAEAFKRATAAGADPNRDHLLLLLPETRALHGAMRDLPPDVIFDHHEFSVANRWISKFGMLQAADALFLQATNPLVPRAISALAEQLYRPAVERALGAHGLSSFWYYTTSNRRSDKVVSMGGNNPGIARNALGLRGAISFLIETRGVGIDREGWQRRVATHVLAARAVLAATADHAAELKASIAAGRLAAAAAAEPLVVAANVPAQELAIPLIHPETAERKDVVVQFQDSRRIEPTVTRPRASGYLLLEPRTDLLERLALHNVRHCAVSPGLQLGVEAYGLAAVTAAANRESINPDQTIRATITAKTLTVDGPAIFIPMSQPAAGIIASVMEPDSPGSYLATGVIPRSPGAAEAPLFRLPAGAGLTCPAP